MRFVLRKRPIRSRLALLGWRQDYSISDKYPFEATVAGWGRLDAYVDAVFSSLQSDFMVMPRGNGFIDYRSSNEVTSLKRATTGFRRMEPTQVLRQSQVYCLHRRAGHFGFHAARWAYVASQYSGLKITQGHVRTLDRGIRKSPFKPLTFTRAKRVGRAGENCVPFVRKVRPKWTKRYSSSGQSGHA